MFISFRRLDCEEQNAPDSVQLTSATAVWIYGSDFFN